MSRSVSWIPSIRLGGNQCLVDRSRDGRIRGASNLRLRNSFLARREAARKKAGLDGVCDLGLAGRCLLRHWRCPHHR